MRSEFSLEPFFFHKQKSRVQVFLDVYGVHTVGHDVKVDLNPGWCY